MKRDGNLVDNRQSPVYPDSDLKKYPSRTGWCPHCHPPWVPHDLLPCQQRPHICCDVLPPCHHQSCRCWKKSWYHPCVHHARMWMTLHVNPRAVETLKCVSDVQASCTAIWIILYIYIYKNTIIHIQIYISSCALNMDPSPCWLQGKRGRAQLPQLHGQML